MFTAILTAKICTFDGNLLVCVANWDDCHIGNVYEDLSGLILNFSGVADRFRNNADLIETIEYKFEIYGASQEQIDTVVKFIKDYIADSVR